MRAVVWLAEPSWRAAVAAVPPAYDEVVLLAVAADDSAELAHGSFAGLLGRGRRPDPGDAVDTLSASAADALLASAASLLGREAALERRTGRVENEVVAAAEGASLLVVVRDGRVDRLGPRSLGRAGRFVVDHAPCPVLLVWPGDVPAERDAPPPPPPGGPHPNHAPPHWGPPRGVRRPGHPDPGELR